MAKPPTSKSAKSIELEPDAWTRFERFVQDIAKAGPQHRVAKHKPHKPREESKVGKRQAVKKRPAKGAG